MGLGIARYRSIAISIGVLKSTDQYMNLHMLNAEEWVDGKLRGTLGEVLVRCNNVLYIRSAPDDQ